MTDTNNMIDVAQREFEHFIRKDGSSICETEEGVICKHCFETHCFSMKDSLVAQRR